MKTENKVLMSRAREMLQGKWWLAIKGLVVYVVVVIIVSTIAKLPFVIIFGRNSFANFLSQFVSTFLVGFLVVGFSTFILHLIRKETATVSDIFSKRDQFVRNGVAYVRMLFFIILWSLLFIVPGIVAALSYSQMGYILADDNSITGKEALDKSKTMMKGNRWKLFLLGLRFIGWYILGVLSLGIGFLWIVPYVMASFAEFYEDVKNVESVAPVAAV